MKKLLLLVLLLVATFSIFARTYTEQLQPNRQSINVSDTRRDGLTLELAAPAITFTERSEANQTFTNLEIQGFIGNNQVGLPELPYSGRFITVPLEAELRITTKYQQKRQIDLNELGFTFPVYPAQPSYSKSQDMNQVQFQYNMASYNNANYYEDFEPFKIQEAGFMRGQRVFEVVYTPVNYNPVENVLTVHDFIQIDVSYENANWIQTDYLHQSTYSPEFERVFQTMILNYEPPMNRNVLVRNPTKYVIICFPAFVDAMTPFVEWKTQEGYEVIFESTANPAVGSTATSIKNYLQQLWNAATPENPAPSFLLLIGDIQQVPTNNASGQGASYVTDLTYVRLQGTSHFPDMYYGRFSAQNITQLLPQIEKNLMYQQFTMPDPSYLGRSINIAGHDSYWATSHANSQVNYLSTHYMNTSNGYTDPYVFLYPASSQSANETLIRQRVSEGLSWATYTAHGLPDQWGDPYFHVTHVYQLNNYGMYPVVIGNTCLSGNFGVSESFSEAWLRAPDKGGVLYIGGSESTYWNEDFWFTVGFATPNNNGTALPYNPNQLGMYDMLFHTHNESIEKWHTNAGAMIYAGNSTVSSSSSSTDMKNYYWGIYNISGDPSLTPYLGLPDKNLAEYVDTLLMGQTQFSITNSAPYARVALSFNNQLVAVNFTDENGYATLDFPAFEMPGDAMIVITAQKYEPIIDYIQIIPADMPYLVFEDVVNNATGADTVDFASISNIYLTLNNLGLQPALYPMLKLSSTENYIEIIEDTVNVDFIPADTIFEITEPFVINVTPYVSDKTVANFMLKVILSTDEEFNIPFRLTINAPEIANKSYYIMDEIGDIIENPLPGETATVVLVYENTGMANSFIGNIQISSTNPLVTINQNSEYLPVINANSEIEYYFDVFVDPETPMGAITSISYFTDYTSHKIQDQITLPLGRVVESFHTGDFSYMNWINTSIIPWFIDETEAYRGQFSASAGNLEQHQTSTLSINYLVETPATIKFAVKTSTTPTTDRLEFFIGNAHIGSWSGETNWTEVEFNVPTGNHLFRWVYRKTSSENLSQNRVWLDYITFPASGGGNVLAPIISLSEDDIDMGNINIGDKVTAKFNLINFGNLLLNGNIIMPQGFTLDKTINFSINPFDNVEYEISFIATQNGPVSVNLSFSSNDSFKPLIFLPVKLYVGPVGDCNPELNFTTNLMGNYPNPFNPETKINFSTQNHQNVQITVYNIRGQVVKNLVNKEFQPGNHSVIWNGTDNNDRNVASGVYFYRFVSDDKNIMSRMVLMK